MSSLIFSIHRSSVNSPGKCAKMCDNFLPRRLVHQLAMSPASAAHLDPHRRQPALGLFGNRSQPDPCEIDQLVLTVVRFEHHRRAKPPEHVRWRQTCTRSPPCRPLVTSTHPLAPRSRTCLPWVFPEYTTCGRSWRMSNSCR